MSRLPQCFSDLRAQASKAVVPYIIAGDPDLDSSLEMLHQLVANGASIIEVGVPFSDPMSEGPVIQKGHERALENGVSLRDALALVTRFRETNSLTPIILMGYANPVERMGYASFADACAEAGVDGVITVDLPPEEVVSLNDELKRVSVDNIFLISPTTPAARVATIASAASGFIYYVAVKGVTGSGQLDTDEVATNLAGIRAETDLPVAVGFGIKDATSAKAIAALADGVVVGSALVDIVAKQLASGANKADALAAGIDLIADIRKGVDSLAISA